MLLAVDIGNTSVHLGLWDGEALRATWRLATDVERLPDEYASMLLGLLQTAGIDPAQVAGCALSSTVPPLTRNFQNLVKRYFDTEPLLAGAGIDLGIRNRYDNRRDVGADRFVDAVAASKLYSPPPLIVVDCGTVTVFDAVSADDD